jgi:4-oxalocrotonate tautomerase
MSLITVKLLASRLSRADKQELIARLTDAAVSVEGEALRASTWVVVEEARSGDWGVGGSLPTSEDMNALRSGAAVG